MERERIDDLGINGYQIIQKEQGFCFGMDAVLLSDFATRGYFRERTGSPEIPVLLRLATFEARIPGCIALQSIWLRG